MTDDRFEMTVVRRPSDFNRWGLVSPTALLRLAEGVRWEAINRAKTVRLRAAYQPI